MYPLQDAHTSSTPESSISEAQYPPLPASYQLLAEQFRSADTIVAMLMKRKEICTFTKLKQAVQRMTRRYVGLSKSYMSLNSSVSTWSASLKWMMFS
jgi:hypothetical protein